PEVVVLSTQPALVHLLDLSGFVLSQAVAGNPDPADVADREAEHVRVFGVGGLPVPGVVRFTGALAGRDVADAGQDHRHVFDEAAWAFEDHAVVLGVAGHPPGDAVCVVLIDRLGDPGRPAAQRGGLRVGPVRGQDAGRVAGTDPPGFIVGRLAGDGHEDLRGPGCLGPRAYVPHGGVDGPAPGHRARSGLIDVAGHDLGGVGAVGGERVL